MKTALYFLLLLFASCKGDNHLKATEFTVYNAYNFKQDSIERGLLNEPPAPKATFYLYHHFIADSSGQLFYYQLPQTSAGCGKDYDYKVPEFIDLRPHQLVQIPQNSVGAFIRLNILNQNAPLHVITIGLLRDTVKSIGLAQLSQEVQKESGRAIFLIRKATHEESVVLDYKKRHDYYSPANVKWDSTKIKFPKTFKDIVLIEIRRNSGP